MAWTYKREDTQFKQIPAGRYRVRIVNAEMAVSKSSGNDMMVLQLEVSGYQSLLWNYIVFLPDRPEITNRMLTQFFDAFGIEDGNFNLATYIGKAGAAQIKHDEEGRAKLHYFLKKGTQAELELPPFRSVRSDTGKDNTVAKDGEWVPVSNLNDLF